MLKKLSFEFKICFNLFPLFLSIPGKIVFANSIPGLYGSSLPPYLSKVWYFDLIKICSQCAIKEIIIITYQQPTGNHLDVRKETGNTAYLWAVKISEALTYSAGFIL